MPRLAIVRAIMPSAPDCRRLSALITLVSSLLTAQAAEVSPAERVETSPGLSPDAVRRVFDSQRQTLASCMRLVSVQRKKDNALEFVPWKPSPDTDDRLRVRFTLKPDGTILEEDRGPEAYDVRSMFLDTGCAEEKLKAWSFPSFPANPDEWVQVEVWARFRTTEAERTAAATRLRDFYSGLCKALSALKVTQQPRAGAEWRATIQRFLSEHGAHVDPGIRGAMKAVGDIAGSDVPSAITIYERSMEESLATTLPCPKLRAWVKEE
ncbi:hypothetical protein HUW63_17400 [Myxococcus sp. AM001]|nr:hypothetical protein [Myxococcus sp. AM001]